MKLIVTFSEEQSNFKTRFVQQSCTFRPKFDEVIALRDNEVYHGDYNVIPRVYEQILETKDKLMEDDVTIEVIPLTTVINLSNGYTATIG